MEQILHQFITASFIAIIISFGITDIKAAVSNVNKPMVDLKNNNQLDHDQTNLSHAFNLDLLPSSHVKDQSSALLGTHTIKPFNTFVMSPKRNLNQTDFSLKLPSVNYTTEQCLTPGCQLKQNMESEKMGLKPEVLLDNPPGIQLRVILD